MEMPSYFIDFLSAIRPTTDQLKRMSEENKKLQDLLGADDELKVIFVAAFVQGSYRRHTALTAQHQHPCDVDVVAVTRLDRKVPPQSALDAFRPFLEKHYRGKYKAQGRSWGIAVDDTVKLDLVPTAAPSESILRVFQGGNIGTWSVEDIPTLLSGREGSRIDPVVEALRLARMKDAQWQLEPLHIPDREARIWDQTHPLAQIEWTFDKNAATNGHYVNVVKAVKWWRRIKEPLQKYPRSYPLEHLIGENCPDPITSVGEGVTLSLENAVSRYAPDVAANRVPYMHDHGFPESDKSHNVMGRVAVSDFLAFYERLKHAASTARDALEATSLCESSKLWRELFGNEFPEAPPDREGGSDRGGDKGGFSPRTGPSKPNTARFA